VVTPTHAGGRTNPSGNDEVVVGRPVVTVVAGVEGVVVGALVLTPLDPAQAASVREKATAIIEGRGVMGVWRGYR
jgi:hypothetical protein